MRSFSGHVPVCAASSFLRSPIVSSGLHLTRIFLPSRSLQITSIMWDRSRCARRSRLRAGTRTRGVIFCSRGVQRGVISILITYCRSLNVVRPPFDFYNYKLYKHVRYLNVKINGGRTKLINVHTYWYSEYIEISSWFSSSCTWRIWCIVIFFETMMCTCRDVKCQWSMWMSPQCVCNTTYIISYVLYNNVYIIIRLV